jgi:hypothetical protein
MSGGLHRLVRHDIGRKLTAFVVALLLWFLLAGLVTGERRVRLEVREAGSLAEADRKRNTEPAIYLVVPQELIVRDLSHDRIRVNVKGLKKDVLELELSAILEFDVDVLGDQDEAIITVPLDRERFKAHGEQDKQFSEFEVNPPQIEVSLARRADAEILLGPENVVVVGRPKAGYAFDGNQIRVSPNRVRISGRRLAVDEIVASPALLKLRPVNVEGRIWEVRQQVGIDPEKVDRSVSLGTASGVVEVSIPVRPMDITRELRSIPVTYANAELLGDQQVSFATETLDLEVTGPRSVLEGLTSEQLAQRIRPVFDWRDVGLKRAHEKVTIYRVDLPDTVQVTDLEGRPPEISYRLDSVDSDPNSLSGGDSP